MLLRKKHPDYITVGAYRLPLIATRYRNSKHLILRYDAKLRVVKLSVPRRASMATAMTFVQSKHGWLLAQINDTPKIALADGLSLRIWGEAVTIRHVGGRGLAHLEASELRVTGEKDFLARRVREYISKETRKRMTEIAESAAVKLDVVVRGLTLRDTTSRWGSCSASGKLSLCWRLAFAPPEVMAYVVMHEVAHIKHHNHSAAFWKSVQSLCPEFKQHERWLKQHGHRLWQID